MASVDSLARFYDLGKKGQWNAADVPWHLPLVPEHRISDRRREVWRSVITQQYQADLYAVQAAAQFVVLAYRDHPAQMYYSVMAQDEARHVEVWARLAHAFGGPAEFDPYLAEMGAWVIQAEALELKIIPLQVFFEGMAMTAFREIADTVPGTVLGDVCHRLSKDDALHHGFG
ncbi:MAG: ferritin-like domain-containing protein, partial [Anaerolineales bacterium]